MRDQDNKNKQVPMRHKRPKPDISKLLKFIHTGGNANLQQFNILAPTKKKITTLLKKNPQGIALERVNTAYEAEFREWLKPSLFGYSDVVEMLKAMDDIVDIKFFESDGQMLLFLKSDKIKDPDNNKENTTVMKMRKEVIDVFHTIISSLGGISVDLLIPEYESRTNQRLNLQELGFHSFPHLLSHLNEVFKTCQRDGQIFLVDPATPTASLLQDSTEYTNTTSTEGMSRSFDIKTAMNLRKLLVEEFPFGLVVNELYAAYEGFYGTSRTDLDYEKHGFISLEAFLRANSDVVSLYCHQGNMYVLSCQPLQHPKPEQINLSYTGNVVGPNENYSLVERLPFGRVQVLVGEVYTPKLFWVMHYGEQHSKQLDKLMDRMLEFYSSPLGNRYRFTESRVTNQMAVAALYPCDQNFYRAFVLSVKDLTTYKIFFVDYGTVCISSLDHLRLLHKNFFELPAQAIKCSLHDVLPTNGKRTWDHTYSKRFLDLVQNQRLIAEVLSKEMTTIVKLWDTSQGEDVNIADLLMRNEINSVPGYLDDSCHAEETVASLSISALKIESESFIKCSSLVLEEASSSQEKGAGTQNFWAHEEKASPQTENLEVQCNNNSTCSHRSQSEENLQCPRNAASFSGHSLLDCSQTDKCSDHMNDTAAAGGQQPCMAPSPTEKEIVTVGCPPIFSDEIFLSDEEVPEENIEEDGLSHSYLIHSVDVFFNKKINVIIIDGVQYVLDTEFPHMGNTVCHLGVTLRKEMDVDIYNLLMENGCNIYEPNGEVRATLILYPFTDMAVALAKNGYSIATPFSKNGYYSEMELSEFGKEGNYELLTFPNMHHSSPSNGTTITKIYYRHGAKVNPPRRPFDINKWNRCSKVTRIPRNTSHQ